MGVKLSRKVLIAVVIVAGLASAGTAAFVLANRESQELAQLERAEEERTALDRASDALTANLEQITENLEQGEGLASTTAEIRELTKAQQASLEKLAGYLRAQLRIVRRTIETLERSTAPAARLAELSDRQADVVERAVAALRDLERFVVSASNLSAELSTQARYGARLAEDSRKAFKD
jgi:flagellar basal body-associated protein FliL